MTYNTGWLKTGKAVLFRGYDESYEFKIFGEYLKFRHFFIQTIYLYESIGQ
jgi:hypothetical protein